MDSSTDLWDLVKRMAETQRHLYAAIGRLSRESTFYREEAAKYRKLANG